MLVELWDRIHKEVWNYHSACNTTTPNWTLNQIHRHFSSFVPVIFLVESFYPSSGLKIEKQ